ncbi:Wall-associated receptor kinase-like 20 [Glycine soja]|uniref:Wall-associated receptor kinase-like 20 n=1 Tax=Glycine soja TaxID=3848 RepID=A0A0B2P436_GLYSO|nr:Wall-associated receptor kinase-like 20 [Glycine soja]
MHLNETLPFSMASGNTKHADFGACVRVGVCCEYKSGGTRKEYVVRVHDGGCAAYQSLVDLNGTTAVAVGKRWPEPGVGIEWVAPQERVYTKCKGHGKDSHCKVRKKKKMLLAGIEIKKATNDFSQENLIGSGGFGEVFKGTFDDGTVFAIKRAKLGSTKGIDQMQNEVQILCQVNHRSLVRLLGCCLELEHPLLIYEYISNGTLFNYLHRHSSGSREPLKWHQRLKIAHQTAEGLCYLHSAAKPPIYHRDVKSSNILLDDKLDAKVSDFGLSRLVELAEENNSHIFASAQGTRGYLDLEYYRNFQLTDKSDIYGFGVVLMELLTAQKAIDFNREEESVNLAMYGKRKMVEDKLMDVVDP